MRFFRALVLIGAPLLYPSVTAAAVTNFSELAHYVVSIMNSAIGTLIVLGLVIFFFGVARNMAKTEQGDSKQQRDFMIMGIVVLFVMVSVWGILELLDNTLMGRTTISGGSDGGSQGTVFCDQFGDCNQE